MDADCGAPTMSQITPADSIESGGIGVIPTDTIYGLVGSALKPETIERIYRVRERSTGKPFIVLIGEIRDLVQFGIRPDTVLREFLEKNWPGPVSIILPVVGDEWRYVHRGKESIAFRLPDTEALQELLSKTGPLVAPSANPEGRPPARTIAEAKAYFGDRVDFYVDGGTINAKPSKLVAYRQGEVVTLRE